LGRGSAADGGEVVSKCRDGDEVVREVPQMAVRLCGKCRDELVPRIRDIRTSDFTTGAGLPLDISLLKPGVYTISLYQGKTQQLGRFIKL
jgi:hypothetical protein